MRRERATGSNAAPNGKRRLAGDTARAATTDEAKALRREADGQSSELSHHALDAPGAMRRSSLDHRRIAAAIKGREPQAEAMQPHLDRIGQAARRVIGTRAAA